MRKYLTIYCLYRWLTYLGGVRGRSGASWWQKLSDMVHLISIPGMIMAACLCGTFYLVVSLQSCVNHSRDPVQLPSLTHTWIHRLPISQSQGIRDRRTRVDHGYFGFSTLLPGIACDVTMGNRWSTLSLVDAKSKHHGKLQCMELQCMGLQHVLSIRLGLDRTFSGLMITGYRMPGDPNQIVFDWRMNCIL